MDARAFTVGQNIAFGRGEYAPHQSAGRHLLAHELTHVVQQQPGRIFRADGDNPLKNMDIALVQKEPPVFQITLTFAQSKVQLNAALLARFFLRPGRYHIAAADPLTEESIEAPSGAVLFQLPEEHELLWISVTKDTDKLPDVIRARDYLKTHDPVILRIWDATEGSGDGAEGKGDSGDGGKFIAAGEWLTKELLPAIQTVLKEKYPSLVPDRMIGYQSLTIQEKEGTDVSMIQIEKHNAGTKQIAGHVRIYRSKWVDKSVDEHAQYAEQVAGLIADKMRAFGAQKRLSELSEALEKESKGLVVPAWVIKLKAEVEKRLDIIRRQTPAGSKPPADVPDKLHVDPWGDSYYFRLIVEQTAVDDPSKMVWNSARMTPALNEDQLDDVDALVKIIRAQTAILRAQQVRATSSDEPPMTTVLMQEIPSEISSINLNESGATVTGARNSFRMQVRIDQYFSIGATTGVDFNLVTIAKALQLPWIDYEWKAEKLTVDNAAKLGVAQIKPPKGFHPSDIYYELSNKDVDQPTKIAIAHQQIDYRAILDDSAYSIIATNRGVLETGFNEPGVYLLCCRVTPHPFVGEGIRKIFPSSKAVFPIRVLRPESLARESVTDTPSRIEAQKELLDYKNLPPQERADAERELDRLKSEEKMSHLELTQAAATQLDQKIERFLDLKAWMIQDRKGRATAGSSETEDPFAIRLMLYDKQHNTRLFEAWRELYMIFGESAYSVDGLEYHHTSEEGQHNALNAYLKALATQKTSLATLIGTISDEQKRFRDGRSERPVATLVAEDTGQTTPLLLMVGETEDSTDGAYKYRIVDLTLRSTPLFERKDHVYVGTVCATRAEARRSALVAYGEENQYPNGNIFYRFPPDTSVLSVPNITTATEYAAQAAMWLAIIGAIAAVAASGGAATPALAAVAAWIGVANALLAGYVAYHNLSKRAERGTFEMDADAALEIITVIASFVAVLSIFKVAQLGRAAQAATTAAKYAEAVRHLQRLGKLVLVFDVVTLGSTAVVVSSKVVDDVERIKLLNLPKAQEDALLQQVSFEAMTQGAMLAFQTVMMARTHIEAYRTRLEESRYQSLQERGWFDENGNLTSKAPPFLRAAAEGKKPLNLEQPPIRLEDELPLLKKAADEGRFEAEPAGSEYDTSLKIKLENGEEHSYRRRKSDGTWCRFTSPNPFCFITKKDIERLVESIGPVEEATPGKPKAPGARPSKSAPGRGKSKASWPTLTQDINAAVTKAMAKLRKTLGKQWLEPWIYGTKLHAEVAEVLRGMKLPKGWRIVVEQPLRKFGVIKESILKMTVEEFVDLHAPDLKGELPEKMLKQRIGDLEPDVVLFAPEGNYIVGDVAARSQREHVAKTMLYVQALRQSNVLAQGGEFYYGWQRDITLNAGKQSAFTGTAGLDQNAVVTMTEKQIMTLLRQHAGEGKLLGDVPTGFSGAAELITGNKKVIGQYYDSARKRWVDTTNFSIHYSEGGLFIRPEKP